MTDEAKRLVAALRSSYGYSSQRDSEAADLIEKLSTELDRVKAELAPETATDREKLLNLLAVYFNIGDSYEYSLTRVKEAFELGTMTFEDFAEFDDEKVADIADYLIDRGVMVARRGPCAENGGK